MTATQASSATFLAHLPCDKCGSSDANSLYDDGHTYCFSCETYGEANEEELNGERSPFTEVSTTGATEADIVYSQGETQALKARGVSADTARHFGYRVDSSRQLAPYYRNGKLIAIKTRDKEKNFRIIGDGSNLPFFGQQLQSKGKRVFVVEGEIDALSLSQALGNKWPVVSVPQGAQSAPKAVRRELEWLQNFDEVVFCFDSDKPGQEAASACAEILEPGRAFIAQLPLKDANEMILAGRIKELVSAVWQAPQYRPDGIIAAKELWDVVSRQEAAPAIDYPFIGLNEKTRGMRKGELVTVTAGSGIGKSAFVRECAHHLVKQGERVGYIALEESVKRTALGLLGIELNKSLHIDAQNVKTADLKRAFNSVFGDGRVYLYDSFGSVAVDNIINKIRYLAKGLECSWIILDHISILISGLDIVDERKAIDVCMTRLRTLVEETGIGLLLVSHLRRPEGNKGFEDGLQVSLNSLRGSHSIGQLSDMVLGLERDQQGEDKNKTTVRVVKNRFTGETGAACHLTWNNDTGRLSEDFFNDDIPF
jgi:twinkle protein